MFIYLDIKIPHLQIAHQGGNLEVGNIKIHQKVYFSLIVWAKKCSLILADLDILFGGKEA